MDPMGWVRENHKADPANTCQHVDVGATFSSSDLDSGIDGGRFLADPDGERRFIGIASGAAFLDQLRQFAVTVLPLVSRGDGSSGPPEVEDSFTKLVGRYQTHDSRPISFPHVNRFYLPPFEQAEQLLSSLSCFGASRDVTTFYWGCLSEVLRQAYTTDMRKSVSPGSLTLATLNAALAVATQQMTTASSESAQSYYARASLLLGRPFESATRQHIPCLCLMGYYLMGENRRDGAEANIVS